MGNNSAINQFVKGECSLEFFNEQVLFRSKNGDGNAFKFLSLASVTAAFRNAPLDSGWIPPGVVRCGSNSRATFAVLFQPAGQHTLWIDRDRGKSVQITLPLPSLVFVGIAREFSVWAMTDNTPQPAGRLFHAPLPNVFEEGHICWGTNKPPRANASTIRQAWDLFITSPFNGHAAGDKTRTHTNDVRGLLRKLRNKRKFPLGELIATGRTLDSAVTALIGGNDVN